MELIGTAISMYVLSNLRRLSTVWVRRIMRSFGIPEKIDSMVKVMYDGSE